MDTNPISPQRLAQSVIAVPPLARRSDLSLNPEENTKLVRFIEKGGVTTLLYGGNANLYHSPPGEYAELLAFLAESVAADTLVIPAVGPSYGVMMDQAKILEPTAFPTAMLLPQIGMTTPSGVATGLRHFVEAIGRPAVLYLKEENYVDTRNIKKLYDDGLLSWVKYAVVRKDPLEDPFLEEIVDLIDPALVVSGMGEQPAIVHMRSFGLAGFTSGCVCVNPRLAQQMLQALHDNDETLAESIQQKFSPLEDLRNEINPVGVLHEAVALGGISETGPLLPLMSSIDSETSRRVEAATRCLCDILLEEIA